MLPNVCQLQKSPSGTEQTSRFDAGVLYLDPTPRNQSASVREGQHNNNIATDAAKPGTTLSELSQTELD